MAEKRIANPTPAARKSQARIEAMEKVIADIDSGRVTISGRTPLAVKRGLRRRIKAIQEGTKR